MEGHILATNHLIVLKTGVLDNCNQQRNWRHWYGLTPLLVLSDGISPVKCLADGRSLLLYSHLNITHLLCLIFFPENYSQTQQCLHALLYNVCLLYNVLALYSAYSKFEGPFPFLLCDQILQNLQNCLTIIWNFWISLCIRKFVLRNFSLMPVASISTYGITTTKNIYWLNSDSS